MHVVAQQTCTPPSILGASSDCAPSRLHARNFLVCACLPTPSKLGASSDCSPSQVAKASVAALECCLSAVQLRHARPTLPAVLSRFDRRAWLPLSAASVQPGQCSTVPLKKTCILLLKKYVQTLAQKNVTPARMVQPLMCTVCWQSCACMCVRVPMLAKAIAPHCCSLVFVCLQK
eukprot:1161530-Pelagomonas_calceolata.AAC.3